MLEFAFTLICPEQTILLNIILEKANFNQKEIAQNLSGDTVKVQEKYHTNNMKLKCPDVHQYKYFL